MKNKKKIQIGVVLFLEFLVVLAVLCVNLFICTTGSSWSNLLEAYVDIPTFFCILLFTLPTLFATGSAKDFGHVFLIGKQELSIGQLKRSLEAVELVQKLLIYAALFTMSVSFIVVLYSMDDLAKLGPSLAVICLTFVYVCILEVLLLPLHLHVQNALTDAMDLVDEEE